MSTVVRRVARWYHALSPRWNLLIAAFVAGAVFALGAIMEQYIQDISTLAGFSQKAARYLVGVLAVALATLLYSIVSRALSDVEREDAKRLEVFAYAASLMDQLVTDDVARSQGTRWHHGDCDDCNELRHVAAMTRIHAIVRFIHQLFESKYGESHKVVDRVEFEVTFMTISYQDGEVTIPAFANRHGRRPRSLDERKAKPKVYDATVTAQIYRSQNPATRIVEDTAEHDDYAELYPGQKKRIRSSIVFPVRSAENTLLGTLVVHCNRARFFLQVDMQMWDELMEVFSKRLALEKLTLDRLFTGEECKLERPF